MINPNDLLQILKKEINNLPNQKLGLLFSGGIDSTILVYLLKEAGKDFITLTVGCDIKSPDIMAASKIAQDKNIEHIIYLPNKYIIEKAKIISDKKHKGDEAVFLGLQILSKFTKKIVATDGIDELMGGYWEHEANINNDRKLKLVFDKFLNLLEDSHLKPMRKSALKVGVVIDWIYLHDSIVRYISGLPYNLRVKKNNRKVFWKEVGRLIDIPDWVIERKKIGFCDALVSPN